MRTTYLLDNGEMGNMTELIRQEFRKDKTRKQIANENGFKYRSVYGATRTMENRVHPFDQVGKADILIEVQGREEKVFQKEYIKELYSSGELTRQQIADQVGVPYGTVFNATKDDKVKRKGPGRIITHPTTGEPVKIGECAKAMFDKGMSRKEIAQVLTFHLGEIIDVNTIWQFTTKVQ